MREQRAPARAHVRDQRVGHERRQLAIDERRSKRRVGMRPDGEFPSAEDLSPLTTTGAKNAGRRGRRRSRAAAPSCQSPDGRLEELRQEKRIGLKRPLGERAIRSESRGRASIGSSAKVPRRGWIRVADPEDTPR